MKSFKKFIDEGIGSSDQDLAVDKNRLGQMAPWTESSLMRKLNAYVGAIGKQSYVMPEEAIANLRNGLSKVGYTFPAVSETNLPDQKGQTEKVSLPLTLFGGRFGKDTDTPYDEFLDDDGISHKVDGGMSLEMEFAMLDDGSTSVGAKIV